MAHSTRFRILELIETDEGGLIFMCGSDLNYYDWKKSNEHAIRRDNCVFKVSYWSDVPMSNELKEFWLDKWLKGQSDGTISTYRLD